MAEGAVNPEGGTCQKRVGTPIDACEDANENIRLTYKKQKL
jgi:hypothetical protein